MEHIFDTAIVGGGIAGYTAALTAKNLRLDYLWLGEKDFGKKTKSAEDVRNFPAFTGTGESFVRALNIQREREGVLLTERRADGIYRQKEGYFLTAGEEHFFAKTVIFATGIPVFSVGEEFIGRGVSYCAVCDGALYKGKRVAAFLSRKEEMGEVQFLARYAEEVLCFCDDPLAFEEKNVRVLSEKLIAIEGGQRVERCVTNGGSYLVAGVFLLGYTAPASTLCGGLKTDGRHVVTDRNGKTNLAGLFAAGDVTGKPYQYVKAAGEGLIAAYAARDYLLSEKNSEHDRGDRTVNHQKVSQGNLV